MIKTAFHLKDPKAVKTTTLFVLVSIPSGRIKVYLPIQVPPSQWDTVKQELKKTFPHYKEANLALEQLTAKLKGHYLNKVSGGSPLSAQDVRDLAKSFFGNTKTEAKAPSLNEVYKRFLDSYKASRTTSTVAKHRRNLELIQSFVTNPRTAPLKRSRPKKGEESGLPIAINFKDIPFEIVTADFVERWVTYLLKNANFTNNTAAKAVRLLNTFLNWATIHGYNTHLKYKDFKPKGLARETDVIALSEEELLSIYYLDLSCNPALARVRDVFCFGAFTGQRFSDVAGLRSDHIKGNSWHLRVQKTTDINRIPLNEFALAILAKYENGRLPAISNQKTNEHLKILGELAGIKEPIALHRYRGAEKIERFEPKYQFIGTHTARRTFATLMLEKGMRPEVVMKIGGWKDYRSFKKYIRLTDRVAAAEMEAIQWISLQSH